MFGIICHKSILYLKIIFSRLHKFQNKISFDFIQSLNFLTKKGENKVQLIRGNSKGLNSVKFYNE